MRTTWNSLFYIIYNVQHGTTAIVTLPLLSYTETVNMVSKYKIHWSQWLCSLRYKISLSAQTLESWVWIPFKTWMYVCFFFVFVLSCVVVFLQWPDPLSKESCQLSVIFVVSKLTLKWEQARWPNPSNEEENEEVHHASQCITYRIYNILYQGIMKRSKYVLPHRTFKNIIRCLIYFCICSTSVASTF